VRASVIVFWHSFVEPFFGRGERTYTQLHTKTELQQLEAEEHAGKASSSSSGEHEEGGKGECVCACGDSWGVVVAGGVRGRPTPPHACLRSLAPTAAACRTGRKEDGAESGGGMRDTAMADAAGVTPEPGTTPEPDDNKGDALAALLAAGAGDMSEQEGDGNEGGRGGARQRGKRGRFVSEERSKQEDGDSEGDRCV
jgi:hypothetical protein